jgi:hypothetical protein
MSRKNRFHRNRCDSDHIKSLRLHSKIIPTPKDWQQKTAAPKLYDAARIQQMHSVVPNAVFEVRDKNGSMRDETQSLSRVDPFSFAPD